MNNKNVSLGIESLENKTLLSVAPNDPQLNNQWALNSISAAGAWNHSTGSKGVVVAVIDSGIDLTNSDLKDNLWTNPGEIPGDGIDNEGDGYVDDVHGWNFANHNNDIQDRYGHGTHIAGIIGAEGDNTIGVAGINWDVSLMALKFMDDKGVGNTGGAIKAMEYIDMMKNMYEVNVVVANASWGGGTGFSSMLYGAIDKLNTDGIILTVAAGNNGDNNDITLRYPSCYSLDNIISVGALDYDGISLASYSNYGANNVDLAAPGSMILSTVPYNNYSYKSGTSMAAPMVAGAVALLKSIRPGLSVSEIKNAIFSSVDKVPELFGKVVTNGKLNLASAACKVLGIPYDGNHNPIGAISSQTLKTISGWAKDSDSLNTTVSINLIIDGTGKGVYTTKADGSFVLNLGGLTVGDHVIEIKARDNQTGLWVSVTSTTVTIKPPVVRVGYASLTNIRGWAFSERSGRSPVAVKVVVNGRVVTGQWANLYRPALIPVVGSAYHGFNVTLYRSWFRVGRNSVTIQVLDPISKQVTDVWKGSVLK